MIEVIEKYSELPFIWGETDCCRFVGEALRSLHGDTPIDEFLYHDETSALDLIASYGSLRDLLEIEFGEPSTEGRTGDIALIEINERQVAGVVFEGRIWAKTEAGVVAYPLRLGAAFWRA